MSDSSKTWKGPSPNGGNGGDAGLMKAVLDGIQDPVFVKDRTGRYVYQNRACAEVLGIDPARTLFTDADILPAEEAAAIRSADAQVVSSRTVRTQEERVSVNGRTRIFRSTKLPWEDEGGSVLGIIGIARDVTEQREAETARRESENRFRLLADAAPVLMWTSDRTGDCDFVNASMVRFTGLSRRELLGDGWMSAIHPKDVAGASGAYRDAFERRAPFESEYRLRHWDGGHRWVHVSSAPRFDEDREFMGYVGSANDVHDARLQQIAVVQSAAELQRLTTELEATVGELRQRTTEAEAARGRAERTERQAVFLDEVSHALQAATLDPEATLKSIADLAVPRLADHCVVHLASDDRFTRIDSPTTDKVAAEIAERYPTWARIGPRRVARTGASELYTELTDEQLEEAAHDEEHLRLLRRQGFTSAMIVPMRAGPRILGTIMLAASESGRQFGPDDVRLAEELARRAALAVENAQLYRQSEEASEAKSEFLATMSHELRTPLNAISGYADLLQLGVSNPEQQKDHLARIKESARSLVTMIEEILTFSRLEAGDETMRWEPLDARDLIQDAVDLLGETVLQKGLELRLDVPDAQVSVVTDRLKVRQILMNLLSNAVKFTDEGAITLRLSEVGDEICFSVGDTGRGLRPEEFDRLYEPFWQAESGMTRKTGGTGIGLAVAHGLSELLGGKLDVESTYGVGSVFTFKLPRTPEPAGRVRA